MIYFERETNEFQPLGVTIDGQVPLWDEVSTAVVAHGSRPTVWTPIATLDDQEGFWVTGLGAGLYEVYTKVATGSESIVKLAGYITIK